MVERGNAVCRYGIARVTQPKVDDIDLLLSTIDECVTSTGLYTRYTILAANAFHLRLNNGENLRVRIVGKRDLAGIIDDEA